jgi:hypothetical protein
MILLANACQGLTSVVSKIKMDTVGKDVRPLPSLPPSLHHPLRRVGRQFVKCLMRIRVEMSSHRRFATRAQSL